MGVQEVQLIPENVRGFVAPDFIERDIALLPLLVLSEKVVPRLSRGGRRGFASIAAGSGDWQGGLCDRSGFNEIEEKPLRSLLRKCTALPTALRR
jgi:hypothetical protein